MKFAALRVRKSVTQCKK